MNDNNNSKKGSNVVPIVIRWFFGIHFIIFAIVNGFHYSSLFLILAAFFMMPFKFMRKILNRLSVKSAVSVLLSVALFILGVMTSPISENEDDFGGNSEITQSQTQGQQSGNPSKPTSTNKVTTSKITTCKVTTSKAPTTQRPIYTTSKNTTESKQNNTNVPVEEKVYIVTFTKKMVSNNSIGNEWSSGVKFAANELMSGQNITVSSDGELALIAYAIEDDASKDDKGSEEVVFSDFEIGRSETKKVNVTVIENDGRYKGNTAIWEFTITVKRIS